MAVIPAMGTHGAYRVPASTSDATQLMTTQITATLLHTTNLTFNAGPHLPHPMADVYNGFGVAPHGLSPFPVEVLADILALVSRGTLHAAIQVNSFFAATAMQHLYKQLRVPLAQPGRPMFLCNDPDTSRPQRLSRPADMVRELVIDAHPPDLLMHVRLQLPHLRVVRLQHAHPVALRGQHTGLHTPSHPHSSVSAPCDLLTGLEPSTLVIRGAPLLFSRIPDTLVPHELGRKLDRIVLVIPSESAIVGTNMKYEAAGCSADGVIYFLDNLGVWEQNRGQSTTQLELCLVFHTPQGALWRPSPRPGCDSSGVHGTWLGRLVDGLALGMTQRAAMATRDVSVSLINLPAVAPLLSTGEYRQVDMVDILNYAHNLGIKTPSMGEWLQNDGQWGFDDSEVDNWLRHSQQP